VPNAEFLLGEDSAFQADGIGSNPVFRSKKKVDNLCPLCYIIIVITKRSNKMAMCPRCFQEKPMLADRCPHCVADVPVGDQIEFSLFTTIGVIILFIVILSYLFG
jgi:uncharacterized paraquat-inducible protein A